MTGRGSGKLILSSPNPAVTIGLSLSTSPPSLSPSSQAPFYITVTARILNTPRPNDAVTLATRLSPLGGLSNRSFADIVCTSQGGKRIKIFPTYWISETWDREDLRRSWEFVTIPPRGRGVYIARFAVPRERIDDAGVEVGEVYRVSLTDKCLGTRWWAYGSLDELAGVRFAQWRSAEEEAQCAQDEDEDPDVQERRRGYGAGPVTMGEEPGMLAMVPDGHCEFMVE